MGDARSTRTGPTDDGAGSPSPREDGNSDGEPRRWWRAVDIRGLSVILVGLTLVVVILILFWDSVLWADGLTEGAATWTLMGFGIVAAGLGSLVALRGWAEQDFVLRLMFTGGAVAIAVGIVHIALGARIESPAGLWRQAEPLPAAFTTVGGTLIGFAGILWSIIHQRELGEDEQVARQHRERLGELAASLASVQLLFDDCQRLTRDALRILRQEVEPFGTALLAPRVDDGAGGRDSAWHLFRDPGPSIGDWEDASDDWDTRSEALRLERRDDLRIRVPLSAPRLAGLLEETRRRRPAIARAFDKGLDDLAARLAYRADGWLREYELLRPRLQEASPEVPIDLIPFVDDAEFLRELVLRARDAATAHGREGAVVIAHFAMVLAALGHRPLRKDTSSQDTQGQDPSTTTPTSSRADMAVKHRGLDPGRIADHLLAEEDNDEVHHRYARPLVLSSPGAPRTLDLSWHWTDEFFPRRDPRLAADEVRVSWVEADHRDPLGSLRVIVRVLTAADLRRRLKKQVADERLKELEGRPVGADLQSARDFWRDCRDEVGGVARTGLPSDPILPTFAAPEDPGGATPPEPAMMRPIRLALAWEAVPARAPTTVSRSSTTGFDWPDSNPDEASTSSPSVSRQESRDG